MRRNRVRYRIDNSWNIKIFVAIVFHLVSLDYKVVRNRTKVRFIIQDHNSNWMLKDHAWSVQLVLKSHPFEGLHLHRRNILFVVKKFNLSTFFCKLMLIMKFSTSVDSKAWENLSLCQLPTMLPKYVVCEEHHYDYECYAFSVEHLFKNIDIICISHYQVTHLCLRWL